VRRVPDDFNPLWTYLRDAAGFLQLSTGQTTPVPRRQELPPAFHRDGSVYVTRREVVLHGNSLYGDRIVGYVVEDLPWVNIDTASDWARAEELLLIRGCPGPVAGTMAGCVDSGNRGRSVRCNGEASK